MKRSSSLLVAYSSSDEDEGTNDGKTPVPAQPPPTKRRKLPTLSELIATPPPRDDPSLHQGRIRTVPHVDGQYATHVYVSLDLKRKSPFYKLIEDVLRVGKELAPTLQDISPPDSQECEFHISLSRAIFLRAHQREQLKLALKKVADSHKPFIVSFAIFSELINDEKTRTFLTLEVGAGHHELRELSDALTPILQSLRQKEYYGNPRFHASIAWALLDRPSEVMDPGTADHGVTQALDQGEPSPEFQTIPQLPDELIPTLNERYSTTLSSPRIAAFNVEELYVKIGKDKSSWRLKGF